MEFDPDTHILYIYFFIKNSVWHKCTPLICYSFATTDSWEQRMQKIAILPQSSSLVLQAQFRPCTDEVYYGIRSLYHSDMLGDHHSDQSLGPSALSLK